MEHEKQVEVVKQALELETQIQVLEQFLPEERAETYAEPEPQPPVRQEAQHASRDRADPFQRRACSDCRLSALPHIRWRRIWPAR